MSLTLIPFRDAILVATTNALRALSFFASIAAMHRANNFDILRLYFACVVVFAHCYDLSLEPVLSWMPRIANSRIAVEGFFVMSGYLVAGSYERSDSFTSYLFKRTLRILPAYWATLLVGLIIGASLSTLSFASFTGSPTTWRYIACQLTFLNFLQPTLPGLFLNNPGGAAVNGALWTIKIEVAFYLVIPVMALWSRRFSRWMVLPLLFLASIVYRIACVRLHQAVLAKQLPGQLCFFAVGTIIFYSSPLLFKYKKAAWACALIACVAEITWGGIAVEAVAVGLATSCIALLAPSVTGPTKYGDFSYGIYVFHYPVIQALIAMGMFNAYPRLAVAAVFGCVSILAFLSWNLLEAPSLRMSHEKKQRTRDAVTSTNRVAAWMR